MTTTYPSRSLTTSWVDLVVATPGVANVDAFLQNTGRNSVAVFFGGAAAPGVDDGQILQPLESFQGKSDHIWVRGEGISRLAFSAV